MPRLRASPGHQQQAIVWLFNIKVISSTKRFKYLWYFGAGNWYIKANTFMQIHTKPSFVDIYLLKLSWNAVIHLCTHYDVIKWKHFPRNWPFVRGIHRSPVNSPHKGQWRGALMFSLICIWINGWVNNRQAGDLKRYRAIYDVTVMCTVC